MVLVRRGLAAGFRGMLIVTAASAAFPAAAQDRTRSEGMELLLASESVVFSAAKKAQNFREVPAAVTVITEEDIQRWGYMSLPDILRMAVGVDVMEPNRSQSNVSIRGFNESFASRLLVMVNGRSIYQDFFGGVFWPVEPLLISSIKRIEIVHGPGSALYGANAFLGVINIITKSTKEQRAAGTFVTRNGLGSQSSVFSETLISGGDEKKIAYTFGAGLHATRGFGERKPGAVRDSFSTPIVTLDLSHKAPRGRLNFGFRTSDATADLSSQYYVMDGSWQTRNLTMSYEEEGVKNPILARYFFTLFRMEDMGAPAIDSATHDFEIQQQRQLGRSHGLIYGANLRANGVDSVLTGPERHSQSLYSAYLQHEWRLTRRTTLFTGGRVDHNTLFGTHLTPRLSLTHQLPAEQTVRFSYGTSFRNPTLADTFFNYPFPIAAGVEGTVVGNPNAEAEEVTSVELGYRRTFRRGFLGASLYHNEMSGLIQWLVTDFAPSPPFPPNTPFRLTRINGVDARATGLEIEGSWKLDKNLRLLANYNYQNVVDSRSTAVDFSPSHKVNVGIDGNLCRDLTFFLGAHHVSGTLFHDFNRPGTENRLPPYTQVDAHLSYRFGGPERPFALGLSATNLLNAPRREFPVTAMPGMPEQQSARHARTVWLTFSGRL